MVGTPQYCLAGKWSKVVPECQGLDEASDLIKLPWTLRKIAKRKTGLTVSELVACFEFAWQAQCEHVAAG